MSVAKLPTRCYGNNPVACVKDVRWYKNQMRRQDDALFFSNNANVYSATTSNAIVFSLQVVFNPTPQCLTVRFTHPDWGLRRLKAGISELCNTTYSFSRSILFNLHVFYINEKFICSSYELTEHSLRSCEWDEPSVICRFNMGCSCVSGDKKGSSVHPLPVSDYSRVGLRGGVSLMWSLGIDWQGSS